MANAQGIDVSHYQGDVDWSAVKAAGYEFGFAKATQGTSYVDPKFSTNWANMRSAGVARGAYHFFEAGDDASAQARHFLATVGSIGAGDLAPVLDVESGGGTPNASSVQAWLDAVQQATGRTPIIYASKSYAESYLESFAGKYPLWFAEYGVSEPRLPRGWPTWTFWQHSQDGRVSGVSGAVDLDYHNGPLGSTPASGSGSSGTSSGTSASSGSSGQTYTVQAGDTLSSIASKYGTTVDAIAQLNGISDPNRINVGQVLKIP